MIETHQAGLRCHGIARCKRSSTIWGGSRVHKTFPAARRPLIAKICGGSLAELQLCLQCFIQSQSVRNDQMSACVEPTAKLVQERQLVDVRA